MAFFSTHTVCQRTINAERVCIIHLKLPFVPVDLFLGLSGRLRVGQVSYLEAKLRSFDCSDVAARTRTHHCDICIDCKEATQQLSGIYEHNHT